MKLKIAFLTFSLAAAVFANATNMYNYTFETAETTPATSISGWVTDGTLKVVDNTVTNGINSSAKCLTFNAQSGIEWWGGILATVGPTTTSASNRYLYMKVRAESKFNTNFTVQLFNGTSEGSVYGATPAVMLDTLWQEYCYVIPVGSTFDKIRLEPRHAGNIYIDDIRMSDVAPTIPNLSAFSFDFEKAGQDSGWLSNFTGKGATYLADVNADPFNTATVLNTSTKCIRIWIENGGYSEYGGGRYIGAYGLTTDATRYLHVRYYYKPNDANAYATLPLWVFTQDGDTHFTSTTNPKNQWTDVTIDLGVGTLVNYLNFTVDGWWITAGIDDVQLDGSVTRQNLTSVKTVKEGSVKMLASNGTLQITGLTEPCNVQVYGMSGIQYASQAIISDATISLQPGIYIVKVKSANNTQIQKVVIK